MSFYKGNKCAQIKGSINRFQSTRFRISVKLIICHHSEVPQHSLTTPMKQISDYLFSLRNQRVHIPGLCFKIIEHGLF